jgi:hypothetical protein
MSLIPNNTAGLPGDDSLYDNIVRAEWAALELRRLRPAKMTAAEWDARVAQMLDECERQPRRPGGAA